MVIEDESLLGEDSLDGDSSMEDKSLTPDDIMKDKDAQQHVPNNLTIQEVKKPPDISSHTMNERMPTLNSSKGNRTSILQRPSYKVSNNPKKNPKLKKGMKAVKKDGGFEVLKHTDSV